MAYMRYDLNDRQNKIYDFLCDFLKVLVFHQLSEKLQKWQDSLQHLVHIII